MRQTILALALALVIPLAAVAAGKEPRSDQRVLVYNEISGDPGLDRAGRALYRAKYQVVDIKAGAGFSPAKVKGHIRPYPDPRPMRELGTHAKAVVFYLVTPEGLVLEPRVGTFTDVRVANYLLNLISMKRYVPARLHGVPVLSIVSETAEYQPSRPGENTLFKDGLGIQGPHDR